MEDVLQRAIKLNLIKGKEINDRKVELMN